MDYKHFNGPYFELEIPTDWVISSDLTYQAIFYAAPHLDDRQGSNLSVIIQSPAPIGDLQDVMTANNEVLEDRMTAFQVDDLQERLAGDVPAYWQSYTWRNAVDMHLRQQQLIAIAGDKLYLFMATRPAVASHADTLDACFAHMYRTIRIT